MLPTKITTNLTTNGVKRKTKYAVKVITITDRTETIFVSERSNSKRLKK